MKRLAVFAAVGLVATLAVGPVYALDQKQQEAQIGAQVYQQLQQKGEIIPRSNPLYNTLDPIAARIASVADPQYDFPFTFILVHEKDPNAFAVPGGHVYVTDALMHFVQNKEELAGVLCHETSHDIHHDVVHLNAKDQTQGAIIGILGALTGLGRSSLGQLGENLLYTAQSDNFSRAVESAADHKGAITCAQAGINPWGMVWLFQNFEKADTGGSMEMLSDHPTESHRIADLEREFRSDPALFGRFNPSIASATPLHVPTTANAAVRQAAAARYCCAPRSNP
ncbi:MAG: M48 family metalloprotease [Vulcanimicrobiaceae bacterium]